MIVEELVLNICCYKTVFKRKYISEAWSLSQTVQYSTF